MQVGTIVKLKVECLGNPKGALGVVFYDYGDGSQAIFKNGSYDGFSEVSKMPGGEIEADYFLEKVGFCDSLSNYEFKSVMQVSWDFNSGVFEEIWKGESYGKNNSYRSCLASRRINRMEG